MEIRHYNYDKREEFTKIVRRYNKLKRLSILNSTKLTTKKRIWLVLEKGVFRKYIIIGYAIIDEDLHIIYLVNDINESYTKDENTIFITDFMVHYLYRKQGIGKFLANYIINEVYENKNIILQPDGDGNWFWKKFGFVNDNVSKHITWILKRKII